MHGAVDPSALRAEGVDPGAVVDFSSNQSPLGAAPGVAAAVAGAVVDAYPDPRAAELCSALAGRHGVEPEQVVCGNGSTELIRLVAQLALAPGDVALALAPVVRRVRGRDARSPARGSSAVPLTHAGAGAGFFCDEPALRAALLRAASAPLLALLAQQPDRGGAACGARSPPSSPIIPDTLFVLDEAYCDLLPRAAVGAPSLLGRRAT